jgi:hypothetical protein
VVVLFVYLMESICHFGSCCDLHQNRFPVYNPCYIDNIAFAVVVVVTVLVSAFIVVAGFSVLDNHVAYQSLYPTVFFCLFFG